MNLSSKTMVFERHQLYNINHSKYIILRRGNRRAENLYEEPDLVFAKPGIIIINIEKN